MPAILKSTLASGIAVRRRARSAAREARTPGVRNDEQRSPGCVARLRDNAGRAGLVSVRGATDALCAPDRRQPEGKAHQLRPERYARSVEEPGAGEDGEARRGD